jgi:SAM-dependent methyltransferase
MGDARDELPLTSWDGERYQARFDALADSGAEIHGEADFVMGYAPESVLDAGCGTGRVALELAGRGVLVVGADKEASMLEVARRRAGELVADSPGARVSFVASDLTELDLGATFDIVLMAGNVPLFTAPGTHGALVLGCARHIKPAGLLVAGFQLGRSYSLDQYDRHASVAGLVLEARFSTWDELPFDAASDYAVSVHRKR